MPPSRPSGKREEASAAPGGGKPAAERPRGGIQSLERAAAILDAVSRSRGGIGLATLSAEVGLHSSTAFHLLKTLANLGFVAQIADTRRYRIGSRLFALAAGALDENVLLSFGTPILERLSGQTGEAAHLAVRSRGEVVVVARTEATGMLQLSGRTGTTRPAHATALGKVLLSVVEPDELERLLDGLSLTALTQRTITDRAALRRELDDARRDGIAYDDCELDAEVRCVAVPVRDFSGRCAGAIGLSGPVWRSALQSLREKSRALRAAAAELSAQLGLDGAAANG